MDIKTETWKDRIINLIRESNKPLQRKDIEFLIKEHLDSNTSSNHIGVILNTLVENQLLCKVKYPGMPSFYAHPGWVDNKGNFKKELKFDPTYKEFIT